MSRSAKGAMCGGRGIRKAAIPATPDDSNLLVVTGFDVFSGLGELVEAIDQQLPGFAGQ